MNKGLFTSLSGSWETPQDLFEALNKEFVFTIDVAASDTNFKVPVYYTKEDNALEKEWIGSVFCNPPYGRQIGKWIEKAAKSNALVVMLIPARTCTKAFHEYIYKKANVEIRFIKGRLHFSNSKINAPFPSMLVIFKNQKELL